MKKVVGDNIQPNGDVVQPRTITIHNFVGVWLVSNLVENVIVIASSLTLVERYVAEIGTTMILDPNQSANNYGKTIQHKMHTTNNQQCLPTGCEQQKYAGVKQYVNQARK